jgi:excisionase family DNA binding protein
MTSAQGSGLTTRSLLTVAQVAKVLRVSNMTVYRLIKSGKRSASRLGKNDRIRESELGPFLAAGPTDPKEVSS